MVLTQLFLRMDKLALEIFRAAQSGLRFVLFFVVFFVVFFPVSVFSQSSPGVFSTL